ncbi:hypothetical protein I2F27_00050 [Acinetobacter sp. B5B]|uniref:hypothetical protein n=1 Tax=Acinetobacter baretiae TaxID=2605383 RepID=UPI0018C1F61F|nr:hypothetical protein [Acinetobacter baretiae]MBF7681729.1 hypothetical protein [Acinetobacter baretiae]MBF7685338.1 hypothetical protein [Acinetobacter baretiae]
MNMKWLLVSTILLMWVAKLTYDQQQYGEQITSLQSQITKANQATDNLNDQFVALQRKDASSINDNKPLTETESKHVASPFNPLVLVKQQLDLIQFSLQQQQNSYALEHLQILIQNLVHYDIAPALKQNLLDTLSLDQQRITQYYQQQELQNKHTALQLQQINQYLNSLMTKVAMRDEQTIHDKTWFSLQHTDQAKTALMSRSIMIKELQLRLLLAQQLFYHGQYQAYQVNMDDMMALTKQSPLVNQTDLQQMLMQARSINVLNLPKLQATALIK